MNFKALSGLCFLFIVLCFFMQGCDKEEDCEASPGYNSEIKPIIAANCLGSGCHNSGSPNGDYSNHAGLQKVASSGALVIRVVVDKTMPPTKPLSIEDQNKIKCWVESGAQNN